MAVSELPRPYEYFPSDDEALLAPVIWGEVYAFAGSTKDDKILPAMNNISLAIKYPKSEWITERHRDVASTIIEEITTKMPYVSEYAASYMVDYIERVITFYRRYPSFFPED